MELKSKGQIENENEVYLKFGRKSPFKNSKSQIKIWKQKFIEIMEIDTWWVKNVV